MTILFSIAGTLLILAGLLALKFCYKMYQNLNANTEVIIEAGQIIDAFIQQNRQAMAMMQGEEPEEEGSFGVNQG